jgi:shikimate dehydrogenase
VTDRYAVFGNPVGHSKSPLIHKLFAEQTGQDMSYEAVFAPLDGFENSVREFIAAGGRGANVTVPFKHEAFHLATQHTARSREADAANTLVIAQNGIVADNTDGAGLLHDIEINLGFSIVDKRILLLGAGGAAHGAVLPLMHAPPKSLLIVNRTTDKARLLAAKFGFNFEIKGGGFDDLAGRAFDLVINATSAGLSNTELPLPDSIFAPGCLAYEMVYGRETPFMRQARNAGARVADGLGMLVEQAAESFFVWRGIRPDTVPVLKLLRQQ